MNGPLSELFAKVGNRRIAGGCAVCDAYQVMEADPERPGLFHIHVMHDDWCPFLRSMSAEEN